MIPDLATLRDRARRRHQEVRLPASSASAGTASQRTWSRYEMVSLVLAGAGDAAGAVGALDRQHRLRDVAGPRLAHDDLPALLRRRRDLLRLRHGADAADHHAPDHAPRALHHHQPPRGDGQGDAADRIAGRLRLRDRVLQRLVLGQPLRALPLHQPRHRPVRVVLLPDGAVQRADAAGAVVEARPHAASRCCSSCRSWSTSACGSSASSSSWCRCTATFLPSGWGMFYPTVFDIGILVGIFGLFFTLFLLFIRFLPMIAMWEVKGVAQWHETLPGRQLLRAGRELLAAVRDAARRRRRDPRRVRALPRPRPGQAMGIRRSRLPFVTLLAGLRRALLRARVPVLHGGVRLAAGRRRQAGELDAGVRARLLRADRADRRSGHGGRVPAARAAVPGQARAAARAGRDQQRVRAGRARAPATATTRAWRAA